MKKNKIMKKPFIIIVLAVLLNILLLSLFNPSSSDVLNFLGNIIGSIIGVIGAYFVLKEQIKNDALRYKNDKDESTYFKILDMFRNEKDDLLATNYDVFTETLDEIKKEKSNLIKKRLYEEKQESFKNIEKDFEIPLQGLSQRITYIDFVDPSYETKTELDNIIEALTNNDYTLFSEAVSTLEERQKYKPISLDEEDWGIVQPAVDLLNIIEAFSSDSYELDEEEINQIVNSVYSKKHNILGNYFRVFHRLVKQIMNSSFDVKQKEEYLGITRAILSSEELLVILYNTFYYVRGQGLKELLSTASGSVQKTGFFADDLDLENFNIKEGGQVDLPFFKYDDLIFGDRDLEKIQSLTNYKKEK